MEKALPAIPAKRYFTIGEVSELCGVKPYVLRYWEQEFTQLKPMKRRGNRRYYQHHEVLLIRRIRDCCTSRASPSAARATGSATRVTDRRNGADESPTAAAAERHAVALPRGRRDAAARRDASCRRCSCAAS